jgi:CheY-like chemotaxis protein
MNETGGCMFVRLNEIVFSQIDCIPEFNLIPGKYLDLEVSDTGNGMDSAILENIFDPYFTTKESGKGTGLGLAVVFGIVKEFKGHITVHSEPEQGSIFHVYLPVIDETVATDKLIKEEKVYLPGEETIMFVDDDEAIREVSHDILEGLGYTIYTYESGTLAFDAYKQNPSRFDLVVTDMTMPGMTGLELLQKILQLKPEQPVVLCSGHSDLINREDAISIGISDYFEKPIITKELAKLIREVLDKAKG